jgi:hypothetical protein
MARRAGVTSALGANRIFHTIDEAVDGLATSAPGAPPTSRDRIDR